jgi:hypothetical protein
VDRTRRSNGRQKSAHTTSPTLIKFANVGARERGAACAARQLLPPGFHTFSPRCLPLSKDPLNLSLRDREPAVEKCELLTN